MNKIDFDEVIVIDNGSYNIRFGIAGFQTPQYVFRNLLGKNENEEEFYIGEKAKKQNKDLQETIKLDGTFNLENMEKIWKYGYFYY
jgi:actin-related protein